MQSQTPSELEYTDSDSKVYIRADREAREVEHLPSKGKALSSNPNTTKKKKNQKPKVHRKTLKT
jgi:hypothetical protein